MPAPFGSELEQAKIRFFNRITSGALVNVQEVLFEEVIRSKNNWYQTHVSSVCKKHVWKSAVTSPGLAVVTWQNSEQYLRDFRSFLRQQRDMLDRLIQRLRNAGLVTAEESAGLRPSSG